MGGFMLCESGRPVQTLLDHNWRHKDETTLTWNIQQKVIDPPRITEEDIKDRSKGDAISKTFIVLQTTWFVVQCIARWSQRLPLTELEVVTLGFAMLNGITYIAWWDKPQNVGRPVFLESKEARRATSKSVVELSTAGTSNTTSEDAETVLPPAEPGEESWLRRKVRQNMTDFGDFLLDLLLTILYVLMKMFAFTCDSLGTKMRVGRFYAAKTPSGGKAELATLAIGALFGSVHLIPSWSLHFSSRQETWLWRVSAIIITTEPVLLGLCIYYSISNQNFLKGIFNTFAVTVVGAILYPTARIILLTLSLTALRLLPSGALQTIEWTTFIPHL
jgi:hypothetical protein